MLGDLIMLTMKCADEKEHQLNRKSTSRPSTYPSTHPSFHPPIHPPIHPSIHPPTNQSKVTAVPTQVWEALPLVHPSWRHPHPSPSWPRGLCFLVQSCPSCLGAMEPFSPGPRSSVLAPDRVAHPPTIRPALVPQDCSPPPGMGTHSALWVRSSHPHHTSHHCSLPRWQCGLPPLRKGATQVLRTQS